MVSLFGNLVLQKVFLGVFLVGFVALGEGHHDGLNSPEEGHVAGDDRRRGEGVDVGKFRAYVAGVSRHVALAREDDDVGVGEGVCQDNSGMGRFLAGIQEDGLVREVGASAALDASRDAVEDPHALDRVFPDGGLAAEHDGVGLLEDGVGHVGHLRAGRHGVLDHRFEHVGGHDHGLAQLERRLEDSALDDRKLFHRALHTEVAAGDHDGIGLLDDLVDQPHRALILDLGHDLGGAVVALEDLAERDHVGGLATEGECDEIDAGLGTHGHIGQIFLGEGGQVDLHPGKVDVTTGAEQARGEDLAADAVVDLAQDLEVDDPVVDKHHVALRNVIDESVVIHADGVELLAVGAPHGELHDVADLEVELGSEVAGADRGALRVHEDADRHGQLGGDGPDGGDDLPHPIVVGVAHVEPEDVHAREDHLPQALGGFGCRTKGGDDLCFAKGGAHENRLVEKGVMPPCGQAEKQTRVRVS
jgi:hypothetical protein